MKILRVINSLEMGGAERSIETNVPVHLEHGIEMDVLLLRQKETYFYHNLKKKGVNIFSTSNFFSIYNPLQIFKIAPYMRKYDIIHVHLFPALYWVAIAKMLTLSKVKLVYTEHSTYNKRRNISMFRTLERFIYKQYSVIIAISQAANIALRGYLGNGYEIRTINNGVNLLPFRKEYPDFSIEKIFKQKNIFIVTQVASLREQKDQDTVIRALVLLPKNVIFCIVGDGPRRKVCEDLAESVGVADRVYFLGKREDVAPIIKVSDVIVMSSHYEGFGRAAVEGMAAGKPVIASNVAGLGDLIRDAGLLFNVGDYSKLAESIESLRTNSEYYKFISENCYKRADEFSSESMINGYEQIYNSIMTKRTN